jgi:hypothetical protein
MIPHVSERPDPSLLRSRYNPYEAGDRAHEIQHAVTVELIPKYASDDNDLGQLYNQSSYRSNPPLFYDDSVLTDRSTLAMNGYGIQKRPVLIRPHGQRQHTFDDNAVYIDTIPKNRDGTRVQVHSAWPEQEENNENYFHLNPTDVGNDPTKRHDYHDEYFMAKQSVVNTKNIISSIHDELQSIVSPRSSNEYHA